MAPDAPLTPPSDPSDERIREGIELLFYAYRDFIADPDEMLKAYGFGRAHHRVVHFVGRNPDMTVTDLLSILRITKQSLGRVLKQLIEQGYVNQKTGTRDRRQRLLSLTEKGIELEQRLSALQRARIGAAFEAAGPEAVDGYFRVLEGIINERERSDILAKIRRR